MTGIFVIFLSQDCFESDFPETKFQTITSLSQFKKVTAQSPIAELSAVISNQMIKCQLSHTWFNQISDRKHHIYLNVKLPLSY